MAKWWKYFINPVGAIAQDLTKDSKPGTLGAAVSGILNPGDTLVQAFSGDKYHDIGDITNEGIRNAYNWITTGEGGQAISKLWDDITGKSQTELQNKLQREMAEEEYQRNIDSIGDTASAYEAAGYNKNLLYSGASPASYSAPQLQAYSGSAKLDTILNRSAKILGMIPALYQATASLEGIDQARERTKQAEIKTMADGMNLINLGYKLGDTYLNTPFTFKLNSYRNSRHVNAISPGYFGSPAVPFDGRSDVFQRYADASLKNKFDLLESIGLGNSLRRTRNAYMGYQYDLDRRYGAAGRIVGMASQSLGAAAKLMPGMKYFFK